MFEASALPLDLEALPPPVRDLLLDLQAQVFAKSAQSAAKDAQVAQLEELSAARDTWIQELEHVTKRQEYLIAELRHALYGKKSEKLDADQRQLIFEDLEVAVAENEAASDQQPDPAGKSRRRAAKRNRGHLPASLPRIEQVIEPENKVCTCGCTTLVAIGEDRSERLDVIPAQFRVLVTVRPR